MRNGPFKFDRAYWCSAVVLAAVSLAPVACRSQETQQAVVPAAVDANGQPVRLLSAFFGLDNGLPFRAHLLCLGAAGEDGMPIVFSHTLDDETLQPEAFRVLTVSGAEHTPLCATLAPSVDPGERRTVLLIGEFGDADDDPPANVRVVEDLLSDGAKGGRMNFRGSTVGVTALAAGPGLVLAELVPPEEWSSSGRGSACPERTRQVIRATWAGGVRQPNRDPAGDAERVLYRVTVERADGTREEIAPAALADLGDGDNNHHLCLGTTDPAVSVAFPAGHLVDPNQDLNPDTRIEIDRSGR